MDNTETLLVGFTGDVLIVGRKPPKKAMQVINAFQGDEAKALFKILTEKKGLDAEVSD